MPNAKRDADVSPETTFEIAVKRFAPAFFQLLTNRNEHYLLRGLSANRRGRDYLVVVRAHDVATLAPVVVFGSGDTLAIALRNASLAVGKGQWKDDKYAGKLVA